MPGLLFTFTTLVGKLKDVLAITSHMAASLGKKGSVCGNTIMTFTNQPHASQGGSRIKLKFLGCIIIFIVYITNILKPSN